jgi:hypothetical protein
VRIIAAVVLRRLVTATAVVAALAATGPATSALALLTTPTRPTSDARAAAGPLSAHLKVSDRTPRQFHGVVLDASSSTGTITSYVFHYGDGVVDTTYQPLAMHGYDTSGTYHATVVVSGAGGAQATSDPVTIHVRDGVPPTVSIDSPRPGQHVRLGKSGVRFTGDASDRGDGVSKVALAIELVHSKRHFKTKGNCIWYDGHQWLLLSACDSPYFFAAHYSHGRWSFRMDPAARIPAGSYVVRVVGIDRAGNISHYYAISLRTILPFELVR